MSFTLEALQAAHKKISSGADFPAYCHEIKQMGVARYTFYVPDGRTVFYGNNGHSLSTEPFYPFRMIAEMLEAERFKAALLLHQQGTTDFPAFCTDCARTGIKKWTVYLDDNICTYFDTNDMAVLTEHIPLG